MLEIEGLFDGVHETLPDGFKMPEIDRFDAIGTLSHVCMCIGAF